MASCILHNERFKNLQKETNLPEGELDRICYDYQQLNGEERLPSAEEVQEIVSKREARDKAIREGKYIIMPDGTEIDLTKEDSFKELNGPTISRLQNILDQTVNNPRIYKTKKDINKAWSRFKDTQLANGITVRGYFSENRGGYIIASIERVILNDKFEAELVEGTQTLPGLTVPLNDSIIEYFYNQKDNNPVGVMFTKVVDLLKANNIPVSIVLDNQLDSIASRRQDFFTSATIKVNPVRLLRYLGTQDVAKAEEATKRILLHEMVHALSAELLAFHPSWSEIRKLDKEQKQFVQDINDLYNEALQYKELAGFYGMNSATEFVAEALTNFDFQQALAKIKRSNTKQTLWDKFKAVLNKALKAIGIDIKSSILDDVISVSETYFNYASKGMNKAINNFGTLYDNAFEESLQYYEGNITPSENTVFVFGSNPEGRHGAGSAKVAREQFGAQYGVGEGMTGSAYALPTKDLRVSANNGLRSISPEKITESIKKFYEVAKQNPSKQFKVAFRNKPTETTLNGYTGAEMIEMFNNAGPIPTNVIFSKEWFDTGLLKLSQKEEKPEVTIANPNAYTLTRLGKSTNPLLKGVYKANTVGQELVKDTEFIKAVDTQLVIGDCITFEGANFEDVETLLMLSIVEDSDRFNSAATDRKDISITEETYNKVKKYPGIRTRKENDNYYLMVSPYYIYGFSEKELRLSNLHNNLVTGLAPTKLRACSKLAMFALSDIITQIQDGTFDSEQYQELKGQARIDIIKSISIQSLLNLVKEYYFTYSDKENIRLENQLIRDNWEAFCELGFQELATLENIQLNQQVINDDEQKIKEVFDTEEETEVLERTGSAIEAWQVGFRQLGAFSSLSLMLKQYLHTLYKRNPSKDLSPEEIEAGVDVVLDSERSIPIPVDATTATASILKWTRYSTSLKEMVNKLKSHQQLNPWLRPLIAKLESNDETFKAQFFTNFCKYFQSYTIITRQDGKLITKQINENEYAERELEQLKAKEEFPAQRTLYLLNTDGSVNTTILNDLKVFAQSTKEPSIVEIEKVLDKLNINYPTDQEALQAVFTKENITNLKNLVGYIVKNIQKHVEEGNKGDYRVVTDNEGNYGKIINLFSQVAGENVESVSYSSGKLHYSYVVPSYLNIITGKLKGNVENYELFLESEYGKFSWFKRNGQWRNLWLKELAENPKVRQQFNHTVVLTKDNVAYVDKNEVQYTASMISMYFYEPSSEYAWFRLPMMSNKPSEEYLKFKKYKGELNKFGVIEYKTIMKHLVEEVFSQELDRISMYYERTQRGIKEGDREFIASFDKNLSQFLFLSFLEDYRKSDPEFNRLVEKRAKGEKLTPEESVQLYKLAYQHIQEGVNNQFQQFVQSLKDSKFLQEDENGNLKVTDRTIAKEVGLWGTSENIMRNLEEFFWNDMFATINILEIMVTDIAFYKDSDDLQKRLAQLHAPYLRPYVQAVDTKTGQRVSDGTYRTIYLKDEVFKSTILQNLKQANKVILEKITDPVERNYTEKFLKDAIAAFEEVNFADAQSFQSPSALRKKLIMFGKWSDQQQAAYERILKGKQSKEDIDVLWTPLKPFVYGHLVMDSHTSLGDLKVPVLNKNSEYTIILADAILNKAGIPNRLSAIYRVMERTQQQNNGIDSIQFESTVKSGLGGIVDISDKGIEAYKNDKNKKEIVASIEKAIREAYPDYSEAQLKREIDEALVEQILTDSMYINMGGHNVYNTTVVHELPFEQYGLQQEVPSHVRHAQQWGSQERILAISDVADKDESGNDNYIIIDGVKTKVSDAKKEYYDLIVKRVEGSRDQLIETLHLDSLNKGLLNLALSRLLRERILEDSRYGADELWAVSINPETMDFNIPLGDPIHADMIEKLMNSIIKNRICKQQIAGGPVVLITNLGTSDELKIRYQDQNNKVLLTEQEFIALKNNDTSTLPSRVKNNLKDYNTDTTKDSYQSYLEAYQVRPAYYECYAPVFDEDLLKYADAEGNIDIEKIKRDDPKLLDMIGYRIPTEMKYSCAPLKIVGFLPMNSEGIMLPAEWTTLSGSDKYITVSTTII